MSTLGETPRDRSTQDQDVLDGLIEGSRKRDRSVSSSSDSSSSDSSSSESSSSDSDSSRDNAPSPAKRARVAPSPVNEEEDVDMGERPNAAEGERHMAARASLLKDALSAVKSKALAAKNVPASAAQAPQTQTASSQGFFGQMQEELERADEQTEGDAASQFASRTGGRAYDKTYVASQEALQTIAQLQAAPDGFERMIKRAPLLAAKEYVVAVWLRPHEEDDDDCIYAAAAQFGADIAVAYRKGSLTAEEIRQAFMKWIFVRIRLDIAMRAKRLIVSDAAAYDVGHEHLSDLVNMQVAMRAAYGLLNSWRTRRNLTHVGEDAAAASAQVQHPSSVLGGVIKGKKGADQAFNVLTLHVLRAAADRGYRRKGADCWRQIMSAPLRDVKDKAAPPRPWPTHAWERVMDIATFLREVTNQHTDPDMWAIANPGYTLQILEARLKHCVDAEFAVLKGHRHIHAFTNGIFNREEQVFYEYSSPDLPPDWTAIKYHNCYFNPNWMLHPFPPTPAFDTIVKKQLSKLPPAEAAKAYLLICATFGRLGWPAGSDDWQMIAIFLGLPGTGKSKLVEIAQMQYEACDVGTLSSHAQRDFGLETLYNKLLVVMPEASNTEKGEGISQYDLQSMGSAENVSVGRKNQPEITVRWDVPLLIVSNVLPRWAFNGGAMVRRGLMALFDIPVPTSQQDASLDVKIRAEFGAILLKCSAAYLALKTRFGHAQLWASYTNRNGERETILSRMHWLARMRFRELSHPLIHVLNKIRTIMVVSSDRGKEEAAKVVGKAAREHAKLANSMPMARFRELCTAWIQANEGAKRTIPWKGIESILEEYGLTTGALDDVTAHALDPEMTGKACTYAPTKIAYTVDKDEWIWGCHEATDALSTADY